jgi:hypothetical protein
LRGDAGANHHHVPTKIQSQQQKFHWHVTRSRNVPAQEVPEQGVIVVGVEERR